VGEFDLRGVIPDAAICLAFVDTTYPNFGDKESFSVNLQSRIEFETGYSLTEVDIYPGASGPGWLLQIPLSDLTLTAAAVSAFFSGKLVNENISAWLELARKLRSLFGRPACLSRSAAASIAIDEIMAISGKTKAKEIQLVDYRIADSRFEYWKDARSVSTGSTIEPMSVTIHVFELLVDGDCYLAVVDRCDVSVAPCDDN
jgi:hypothetical protein